MLKQNSNLVSHVFNRFLNLPNFCDRRPSSVKPINYRNIVHYFLPSASVFSKGTPTMLSDHSERTTSSRIRICRNSRLVEVNNNTSSSSNFTVVPLRHWVQIFAKMPRPNITSSNISTKKNSLNISRNAPNLKTYAVFLVTWMRIFAPT